MKQIYLACILGLAFSAFGADRADAQGRSGNARATNQPPSAAASGASGVKSKSSSVGAGSDGSIDQTGGTGTGAYGDLQGNFSHPIGETIFLRLNGAVDLEEQTGASSNGEVRGTIGLGWKY